METKTGKEVIVKIKIKTITSNRYKEKIKREEKIMKNAKKLVALLLTFVMMLAMTVAAFADETSAHTITITNADPAKAHTYEAYQVFKGTLADGKLTKLEWGDGVVGAAILTELQKDETFKNAKTAQDVADIIGKYADNSADIDKFASIVGAHLGTVAATSSETASSYTLNVTGDGYYFVKDQNGSITGDDKKGETYSKYMLKVIEDETIEAKDDHLKPEKKIIEGEEKLDENSAAIGDTITYEITIPMPAMDGYETYFFQMNDTLDKGLTFEKVTSITIAGGANLVTSDANGKNGADTADYSIKTSGGNGAETTLDITYKHFINYKGQSGSVVVTYEATLNEYAELTKSNDNTVKYTYSNDPAHSGEGEPGEPNPENPRGETPDSTVKTWVTKLQVLKTGDNGTKAALEGAQFTLAGEDLNVVLLTGTKFVENAEGTYYLLKDGTYTETAPTEKTTDKYADTSKKYSKETYTSTKTETGDAKSVTAVTGEDGIISFTGLKPGTYTLTEDVAPVGYNKVDPITLAITWDGDNSSFDVGNNSNKDFTYDKASNTFKLTVDNKSGATLPSTGGMGTTIFYVLGSLLAIGAAVVLISKRRAA